jgi:outer membrane protein assembly factor BamB
LEGATRRVLWSQEELSWRQPTQPLVRGDYLLVGDFEGYIHALSLLDGSLQGQLEFDDEGLRVPMQPWQDGFIVYSNGGLLALLELHQSD